MKFTKMHGIGNDYIYVNGFEEQIDNPAEVARAVSDRHFGIGSDGLILILPAGPGRFPHAHVQRGRAVRRRCAATAFVAWPSMSYDHGMTQHTTIQVETLGGVLELQLFPQRWGRRQGLCEDG